MRLPRLDIAWKVFNPAVVTTCSINSISRVFFDNTPSLPAAVTLHASPGMV